LKNELSRDARRFQDWQADSIEGRPAGTELLSVGPFRVMVAAGRESDSWVSIAEEPVSSAELQKSALQLRLMFERWKAQPQIEYNDAVFPNVSGPLEAAGFQLKERNPLMAVRPNGFRPFAAPEVKLARLEPSAAATSLSAFQEIRWTDGGDAQTAVPPVERLQKELAGPHSVYLLAWLDGEPAGTGVSHALKGAGEIVGVVTRKEMRRRGVAATVTSELVSRHFASGGDFVFLDAANEEAARVYERLGFTRFGSNLVYR